MFLPRSIINSVAPDLAGFGQEVLSKQILDWVTDAERDISYLKGEGRCAFGRRTSELIVTEGWRKLEAYGIEQGYVHAFYITKV